MSVKRGYTVEKSNHRRDLIRAHAFVHASARVSTWERECVIFFFGFGQSIVKWLTMHARLGWRQGVPCTVTQPLISRWLTRFGYRGRRLYWALRAIYGSGHCGRVAANDVLPGVLFFLIIIIIISEVGALVFLYL